MPLFCVFLGFSSHRATLVLQEALWLFHLNTLDINTVLLRVADETFSSYLVSKQDN